MKHTAQHSSHSRPRAIAIFGGSFDPVHVGHLAIARAAQRRFHLDEIHFVVAGRAPHKPKHPSAPFAHRYAMVALACAEHAHLVPSLAEAGSDFSGLHTHFSVDTVRHFRQQVLAARDQLYFLLGVDMFLSIPTWRSYESLLNSCDFIVVSRPGYKMEPLRLVIPPELLGHAPRPNGTRQPQEQHTLYLRKTAVHLLDSVRCHVSSTDIRRRRKHGESIHGLVPARVEDYILQQGLYH